MWASTVYITLCVLVSCMPVKTLRLDELCMEMRESGYEYAALIPPGFEFSTERLGFRPRPMGTLDFSNLFMPEYSSESDEEDALEKFDGYIPELVWWSQMTAEDIYETKSSWDIAFLRYSDLNNIILQVGLMAQRLGRVLGPVRFFPWDEIGKEYNGVHVVNPKVDNYWINSGFETETIAIWSNNAFGGDGMKVCKSAGNYTYVVSDLPDQEKMDAAMGPMNVKQRRFVVMK